MKKLTRKSLEKFLMRYASNGKVLDIGSGGSSYSRYFPNRLCVDVDVKRNPNVVADAHALPFADEEFDTVLCTEVFEHLKDPQLAAREMRRVIKPGGKLILSTRFMFPVHDAPHDYFRYTKYGLRDIFAGWHIQELVAEAQSFTTVAILFQRLIYQTNLPKVIKALLLIFTAIRFFDIIPHISYADIKKSSNETDFFTSGYYMVAVKT